MEMLYSSSVESLAQVLMPFYRGPLIDIARGRLHLDIHPLEGFPTKRPFFGKPKNGKRLY